MTTQTSKNLLRISSENGSPVNEYRIHQGQIEFRSLDIHDPPVSLSSEQWQSLDVADIQFHFVLKTVVAQWLIERLGTLQEDI